MPPVRDSVVAWYLTGNGLCRDLFYQVCDFVIANRKHWATGFMLGLSTAATIFLGSSDTPMIFLYGAILGFAIGAAKYVSQNSEEIIRYGAPTALVLLVISIFLFHGLSSLMPIFTWLPVFVSVALLSAVNIAPAVTEIVTALSEGLLALRELGRTIGLPREQTMDVEQAQDVSPGMTEHLTYGHRRYRNVGSIWSYLHRLPEARNLELPEDRVSESVDLDGTSISTTTEIRALLEPMESDPDLAPQYIPLAPIRVMNEQSLAFPQTPQALPPEKPFPRRAPSPSVEEHSLELLIPS